MANGKFVISLDFEIYWGMRDVVKLENYKEHLSGVRRVIPLLLKTFEHYQINATFATVGFLFFYTKTDLLNGLPVKRPNYSNPILSPYHRYFQFVGENETEDPFHFASSMIDQIKKAGQEIGSHTFSHYYCLEKGQTKEDFRSDLIAAKKIAREKGVTLESFVFPRNQFNIEYLRVCKEEGFTSFRGNEKSWLFSSEYFGSSLFIRRPFRFLDAYFNLSGHNCRSIPEMKNNILINIPSSRFLRPYNKKLKAFENRRLKRITSSMSYAAKNGLTYHLWWHPHNFGVNIEENFSFLEEILIHFSKLKKEYNFESRNMQQLTREIING